MTPEERRRAGVAVAERIETRGTTPAAVARAAGVDVKTLRALIAGNRWPTVAVRTSIESELGWRTGEISRQARDGLAALAGFSDAELAGELLQRARRRERPTRRAGGTLIQSAQSP